MGGCELGCAGWGGGIICRREGGAEGVVEAGDGGAPLAVLEEVFVAEVEWDDGGAILRDWGGIISGLCDRESRSGADHLCSLMEAVIRELDVGT